MNSATKLGKASRNGLFTSKGGSSKDDLSRREAIRQRSCPHRSKMRRRQWEKLILVHVSRDNSGRMSGWPQDSSF